MRKLIVSMNVTLDGFISGTNCELDWHFERWSPDMGEKLIKELSKADTILLGRITYERMAKHWSNKAVVLSCSRDDIPFVVMMNNYHKVVYSKTLSKTEWKNSKLIKGNIEEEIKQLKQPGAKHSKDIIVYGSGKLVAALVRLNLVDEYQLWVHPVVLGKGKPLFRKVKDKASLKLLKIKTFNSGVVLLNYGIMHTPKSRTN